jgi:ribosomal protein L11 methyltransferase
LLRLAVRVHRRQAELVLAELLELAPSGVEEVDVSTEEIADDWADRWRSFHRPLVIGDRLTVRPPWEPPAATELDVVIDPGQAFGTGAHATTHLCLELILDTGASGGFVDLGCGSGVLAIVAAKLGGGPVTALDYDKAATAATRENARRNGVELEVVDFDLRYEQVPDADLVAANVLAAPLVGWAASQRRLAPNLILSGLLASEADRVAAAFGQRGRREHGRRLRGEWAALLLRADETD